MELILNSIITAESSIIMTDAERHGLGLVHRDHLIPRKFGHIIIIIISIAVLNVLVVPLLIKSRFRFRCSFFLTRVTVQSDIILSHSYNCTALIDIKFDTYIPLVRL